MLLMIILLIVGAIGYFGLTLQKSYEDRLLEEIQRGQEFEESIDRQCQLKWPLLASRYQSCRDDI